MGSIKAGTLIMIVSIDDVLGRVDEARREFSVLLVVLAVGENAQMAGSY